MKLFQKAATLILLFFMGLMLFVAIVAYVKKTSGSTRLDMGKIQQLRYSSQTL